MRGEPIESSYFPLRDAIPRRVPADPSYAGSVRQILVDQEKICIIRYTQPSEVRTLTVFFESVH